MEKLQEKTMDMWQDKTMDESQDKTKDESQDKTMDESQDKTMDMSQDKTMDESQNETKGMPLIEFCDVYKTYIMGDTVVNAADGISLKINKGEFVAIVGKSGSGKSTCMNIIGCLDVPSKGEYLLDGENVGGMDKNALAEFRNSRLGFIFQQYNLLPKLSVLDNVAVPLMYAGMGKKARRQRAQEVLESVGLGDKQKNLPSQLSGGQQQRVSIARALANHPSVILADEPTGALDSRTGREVLGILRRLHQEGNTVILITHDNSIAATAERVIRLEDGKVVFDGLASDPASGVRREEAAGNEIQ